MNQELEFSIMADSSTGIQPLLDQFEAEQHIHVRLRLLSWDTAWSDLVKVALYNDGPDVSEIGTTWLGDLVAMDALRPFDAVDVARIGKPTMFLPTAWRLVQLIDGPETWAIPWLIGARLLFYRRRWLRRAGLDETTAFQTAAQFERTLAKLKAQGVAVPWTVPTGVTHTTLLNVASWVWGAGGNFVTPDGKRTRFNQPAAHAGLRAYFALGRYLAPGVQHLSGLEPDAYFLQHDDTALTMSGTWLFNQAAPALKAQLGVALPPGVAFVGGSHLIVWKHTRREDAALKLIHFLLQTSAQVSYGLHIGLLPVQLGTLATAPFATEPLWQTAIRGLKTGRSFPVTRSWGLMEDRLTTELGAMWAEVLAKPDLDLDEMITRRLTPLAERLDLVAAQL